MKRQAPGRTIDPLELIIGKTPIIHNSNAHVSIRGIQSHILWYVQQRITSPCFVMRVAPNIFSAPNTKASEYIESKQALTLLEIGPKDKPLHVWLRKNPQGVVAIQAGGGTIHQEKILDTFLVALVKKGVYIDRYFCYIRASQEECSVISSILVLLAQDVGMEAKDFVARLTSNGLNESHRRLQYELIEDIKRHIKLHKRQNWAEEAASLASKSVPSILPPQESQNSEPLPDAPKNESTQEHKPQESVLFDF